MNQIQSLILLVLAISGIIILIQFQIMNLLMIIDELFFSQYLDEPDMLYRLKSIIPMIMIILLTSVSLYLCFYTVRIVLKNSYSHARVKILSPERKIRWFNFKINQSQSIFLFLLSIVGILYFIFTYTCVLVEFSLFLHFFESFTIIPVGEHYAISHIDLDTFFIHTIPFVFLIISIYTLIKSRLNRKGNVDEVKHSFFAIILFIGSLIILILLSVRLITHLLLFTDMSVILGISPRSSNSYQFNDFIRTLIGFVVCIIFILISYYFKFTKKPQDKDLDSFKILGISITPKRALIFLSISITGIFYFTMMIFSLLLTSRNIIFNLKRFYFRYMSYILIPLAIIAICLYFFNKLANNKVLNQMLGSYDRGEIKSSWFGFKLHWKEAFSLVGLALVFLLISLFYLIPGIILLFNIDILEADLDFFTIINSVYLSSYVGIIIFCIYTIKKCLSFSEHHESNKNIKEWVSK